MTRRVEVQSLASRTTIRYGQGAGQALSLGQGEGITFADEKPAGDPVIVEPEDPGGRVVLLAERLASDDPDEVLKHASRLPHRLVVSVRDVAELQLEDVKPLAERAANEDRTLVIRVGDE
jgi:hypothetical protein